MFSALGNIFSAKPRQAEHTDTRQAIQRHDPDFERRRKKKEQSPEEALGQDNALVSVSALREFLENFVKNSPENTQQTQKTQASAEPKEAMDYNIQTEMPLDAQPQSSQKSAQAAQAASAYQNRAQSNEKSKVLLETTDQSEGPALDLSSADIRVIYTLIEDLKLLREFNIEYLRIERAATFLDSLVTAVNAAKSGLS